MDDTDELIPNGDEDLFDEITVKDWESDDDLPELDEAGDEDYFDDDDE
jgi:hypothetical protein